MRFAAITSRYEGALALGERQWLAKYNVDGAPSL
jgi:hypothetical protein